MEKKTIQVTQDDIEHGKRECGDTCAVARAMQRAFPGRSVHVGATIVWFGADSFPLPRRVQDFISDFDDGKRVQPFTFDFEPPQS